jgi:class 3 adenylate cyclase/tetratricopeptide (TPR) repeat protein
VPDQRRLAAIVSADVAGYSRLMGRDESGTLAALKAHRRELLDPKIAEYHGRIVKTTGDGLLLEFASVVDAVRCAVDVQLGMARRNAGAAAERRIDFRIGVNVGDIIIDGDDIHGDGVNIAARLEALAEPGSICASQVVRDQVLDKLDFVFADLGSKSVKNIARPVHVYRIDLAGHAASPSSPAMRASQPRRRMWLAAATVALAVVLVAALAVSGVGVRIPERLASLWSATGSGARESNALPTGSAKPMTMSLAFGPMMAPGNDGDAMRAGEALQHDLATGLGSLSRSIRIVAVGPDSYPNMPPDFRERARRAGARYVVEGDIRGAAATRTVALRLVETERGAQAWAGRFTLPESNGSFEGAAAHKAIVELRDALWTVEIARLLGRPADPHDAMGLVVRAQALMDRGQSLANVDEARKLLDEALRLDPTLLPALTGVLQTVDMRNDLDPQPDHEHYVREYDDFSARAVTLDPGYASAWNWRAVALLFLGRWAASLEASDRAIRLEPYDEDGYLYRAWLLVMLGRPAESLQFATRAMALGPSNPGYALRHACEAELLLGHADKAIEACERSSGLDRDFVLHSFLAAAYANKGDIAHARASLDAMLKLVPGYTVAQLKAKRYSDHPDYQKLAEQYWYEGLRKAGLTER